MTRAWRACVIALCLFAAGRVALAQGGERILEYAIEVSVDASGALDVAEHIAVRAEGNQIRRGIYRDFPTRYRDRYGNNVVVDLEVRGVERDGVSEPWFTERRANGVDAVLVKPLQIHEILDALAGVARARPAGSSEER